MITSRRDVYTRGTFRIRNVNLFSKTLITGENAHRKAAKAAFIRVLHLSECTHGFNAQRVDTLRARIVCDGDASVAISDTPGIRDSLGDASRCTYVAYMQPTILARRATCTHDSSSIFFRAS